MSTLGQAYRIMYLSKGRTSGLTGIIAVVLRPDKGINGIFPLTELPGMFKGCYVFDYLTSVEDREGSYFSLVISPSEHNSDITRFELSKPAGADTSLAARPVNISGYLQAGVLDGYLEESEDLWARVSQGYVVGYLKPVQRLGAEIGDIQLRGIVRPAEQIL